MFRRKTKIRCILNNATLAPEKSTQVHKIKYKYWQIHKPVIKPLVNITGGEEQLVAAGSKLLEDPAQLVCC